jgi:hypothetical protein
MTSQHLKTQRTHLKNQHLKIQDVDIERPEARN